MSEGAGRLTDELEGNCDGHVIVDFGGRTDEGLCDGTEAGGFLSTTSGGFV